MRVPIDWLKELVSFRAGPDQLAELLTMAGLETTVLHDDILEVDVLPNRADSWSIRGVAREVSAITKFKMKNGKWKIKESAKRADKAVKVEVREKDLCQRYMCRVIDNVKVGASPEWLRRKIEQVGLRPINNVVDVTNYLLHEIGQPLHAFDAAAIKDHTIIVRRASPGEKAQTLDGKEHSLTPDNLVISDPEKVIAVAGVMGCANSEVGPAAPTIILESAFFNPVSIHKTSKQLKLRSESSIRFEHGVDFEAVEEALDRGAALIAELGRGQVLKGKLDIAAKEPKPRVIELRLARLNEILGCLVPKGDVISILKRLGFKVGNLGAASLRVVVPSFRIMDIEREIDLIEEIARLWGYNRIPATMPNTAFPAKEENRPDRLIDQVKQALAGAGLNEVLSYSLLGPKDFERTGIPESEGVALANPLTVEQSILRPRLLPGLLKIAEFNQHRQVENIFIFEIGRVFKPSNEKLPKESWRVGGLLAGSPFMSALDKGAVDYFYVKGVVENLLRALGAELPTVKESDNFLLQPGKGAEIEGVGIAGALHPDIQRNYGFLKPVVLFELDLDALFKRLAKERRYQPLPRFPFVSRDISMHIPPDLTNQTILDLVREVGGALVENAFPFDRYKDSTAYRVVYRHSERTLTESEVNAKHNEIVGELTERLKVKIRV